MADYGKSSYGADVYGQAGFTTTTPQSVRRGVGKKFDVALAGIGMLLAPGQKAYSKKAAQTFSFNYRSLFSSSTRLTSRDLFFWNRLEHDRWDQGETYEPWAPDATQATGLPSKYFSSTGFDVSQPHQLLPLNAIFRSPTYNARILADGATQYWPLTDPAGTTTLSNLVGAVAISAATVSSPFVGRSGPLYRDTSTAYTVDGTDNTAALGTTYTPTTVFSVEFWMRPSIISTRGIAVTTGGDSGGAGGVFIGIGNGSGGFGSRLTFFTTAIGWHDAGYTFPIENVWYHIVLTTDNTTIKTYVNGVITANTFAEASGTGAAYFGVGDYISNGTSNFGGLPFRGDVYGFAYYSGVTLPVATILNHYNLATNNGTTGLLGTTTGGYGSIIDPSQTYSQFVETSDGPTVPTLWINSSKGMVRTSDNGVTWVAHTPTNLDTSNVAAVWTDGGQLPGANIYVATATNVYKGNYATPLATFNGANPALAGVTAGWYDGAQIYVGVGTSLYYVDPATGIKTQLYDTKNYTIKAIRAFNGKIWFAGTNGRATKLFTWTNNTLPPSSTNGVGAQIQDGTIPYNFIVTSFYVYQSLLLMGGYFPYTSLNDGTGAVYYVNLQNTFGQLCIIGSNVTNRSYAINQMWGSGTYLNIAYNNKMGVARYDFSKGAFEAGVSTQLYPDAPSNQVLALAVHKGSTYAAIQADGTIWKEAIGTSVLSASIDEQEFQELPMIRKIIDGIEGSHSALKLGQSVEVQLSFDYGVTWTSAGINGSQSTTNFDFNLRNVSATHWRSRLIARVGMDGTMPSIYNWAVRFSPIVSPKHEWLFDAELPTVGRYRDGSPIFDPNGAALKTLWSARENGTIVDFIDRDGSAYKVLVLELKEMKATDKMVKANAQTQRDAIVEIELLEVSLA